jgi:hypothetical protein
MDKTLATVIDPIDLLLRCLDVNRVLGVPGKVGDVAVIPVAELMTGFGYSLRLRGRGKARQDNRRARSMGYLRVADDGVEFEPMFDLPRMSLTSFCLTCWILFWLVHIVRDLARARR